MKEIKYFPCGSLSINDGKDNFAELIAVAKTFFATGERLMQCKNQNSGNC